MRLGASIFLSKTGNIHDRVDMDVLGCTLRVLGRAGSLIRALLIPNIAFKTKWSWFEVQTAFKLSGSNNISPSPILVQGNARALPVSSPELEDIKYALACFNNNFFFSL